MLIIEHENVLKEVKQSNDDSQNKMIRQLQKNQKAITSGLEDLALLNQLPEATSQQNYLLIINRR